MNKRFFLTIILFLGINFGNAQVLSPKAEIYVLSCSPGDELYQAFGHTAIWVIDSTTRTNYIFHYGTFNYSDPHFYTKFIRGRLDYMIATENYQSFITQYSRNGRDVYKLKLNLTYDQKLKFYEFLLWNIQPENKYYKYEFFTDNCATRVRDAIEKIDGDSIIFYKPEINLTYRQAIEPYLISKPWTRFGINLLIGLPADKKLDYYSAMFLPDYIDTIFTKSQIIHNGKNEPLILSRTYLIESHYKQGKKTLFNPQNTFYAILILILILTFIEFRTKKYYKFIDFAWFLTLGIAGLLMLFMWFGTDHISTKNNLNIIWAFPVHLYFAIKILKKKTKFTDLYAKIFAVVNLLLIFGFKIFPQQFDAAVFPILLISLVRLSAFIFRE